jgi:acyl-CoA thioester hydrolase
MVAVEQHIEYERELLAGDIVSVHSGIIEIGNQSLRMIHEMRNDVTGELSARTTIVGVHIDTKVRKACALPAEVRARARGVITGDVEKTYRRVQLQAV